MKRRMKTRNPKHRKGELLMLDEKNIISVTLHVFSRQSRMELNINRSIREHVRNALKDLMDIVSNSDNLTKRLLIPSDVPVKWNIEITVMPKGLNTFEGHIPMMVSVAGIPKIMENLRGEVMEEVTNTLFDVVRTHPKASRELAETLGYHTDKPMKFHVYLPDQLRVRDSADSLDMGDCDCDCHDCDCHDCWDCDCYDCGGWSKGCNSWPW